MLLTLLRFCYFERRLVGLSLLLPLVVLATSFAVVQIDDQLQVAAVTATTDGFPVGWYRLTPLDDAPVLAPEVRSESRASVFNSVAVVQDGTRRYEVETTRYWLNDDKLLDGFFAEKTVVEGRQPSRPMEVALTTSLASLVDVGVGEAVTLDSREYRVVGIFVVPTVADALATRTVEDGVAPSDASLLFGPDAEPMLQRTTEELGAVVERSRVGHQGPVDENDLLRLPTSGVLRLFALVVSMLAALVTVSFLSIRFADNALTLRAMGWPETGYLTAGAAIGAAFGIAVLIGSALVAGAVLLASRSSLRSLANQHWVEFTWPVAPLLWLGLALLVALAAGFSILWPLTKVQAIHAGGLVSPSGMRIPLVVQAIAGAAAAFTAVAVVRAGMVVPAVLLVAAAASVWLAMRLLARLGSRRRLRLQLVGGLISLQNWYVLGLMTVISTVLLVVSLGSGVIQRVDSASDHALLPPQTFSVSGLPQDVALLETRVRTSADVSDATRVGWHLAGANGGDPVRVVDGGSSGCLREIETNALPQCAVAGRLTAVLEVGFVADADYARLASELGLALEEIENSAGLGAIGLGVSPSTAVFNAEYQEIRNFRSFDSAATVPGIGGTVPGLILRESDLSDYGLVPSSDYAGVLVFDVDPQKILSALRGFASQSPSLLSEFEPGRLPSYVQSARHLATLLIPITFVGLYLLGASLSSRSNVKALGQLERVGVTSKTARRLSLLCHGLISVALVMILTLFPLLIIWWASRRLGAVVGELAAPGIVLGASAGAAVLLSARRLGLAMTRSR